MRIVDERITGIYTLLDPLKKAGFTYRVVPSDEPWAYVYLPVKWGWFSYQKEVAILWFRYPTSYSETHIDIVSCHDEVLAKLKEIPEFERILIYLKGIKDVGGTRMA